MGKPEPVTEKDIDTKVIPVLNTWVKESGSLGVLNKHGIKNYLFLLVGGSGFGYAVKGTSDIDLMLIYDGYKNKCSIEKYERMHKVLHEYYFATIGRTEEEGERVRKELEKKREDIVSLLEKEKQVSRETLCEDLREILDATLTSDEYDARILWFGKPENPKRLLLPGVGMTSSPP